MRALIHVPIVHSQADLGSVAGELRQRFEELFGAGEWAKRNASVEAMWAGLERELWALPLSWERTRIYQDGLPVCGREQQIVTDLAAAGSHNHQLVARLVARGATLMGTESAELMLREYRRTQRLVAAARERAPDAVVQELVREGEAVLRERDAFIAERIDATLGANETGILFLGLLHRVDELLEGSVAQRHINHELPFGAEWRGKR